MTAPADAQWDAEIDAREYRGRHVDEWSPIRFFAEFVFTARHAHIRSLRRERDIFDPAYSPRHAARKHRAGDAS